MEVREGRTAQAINRARQDWYADYLVLENGRVTGTLYLLSTGEIIRESFNVAIKDGRFNVDIGTGSGVKVTFQVANE